MAYIFGDGFDLYSAVADAGQGFWDSSGGTSNWVITTGRFTGSQAAGIPPASSQSMFIKSSGVNDAVHKFVVSVFQSLALTGTTNGICLTLFDGTTAQCSVCFRSDGAILLTSGASNGTTLATYTSAFTQNTWTAFEIEVVINNTTGSFTVRKNGNTSNDFSATSLNTRGGTSNNYANKLQVITGTAAGALFGSNTQRIDDLLWRSDASSLAWVGDVRCYTRSPVSDVSTQFSKMASTYAHTPYVSAGTTSMGNGTARYAAFTAAFDGTIGSAAINMALGYTGNMKCTLFTSSGSAPTTVIQSAASAINNPVSGNNTFTFSPAVSVSKGTQYYIGFDFDTTLANAVNVANSSGTLGLTSSTAYASFPTASPGVTTGQAIPLITLNITIGSNATLVADTQQDSSVSYVQDATVSDTDWYNLGSISGTPASTVAVTTRGFVQKTDAGSRIGAVQLKSSSTTVQASGALSTSWSWLWRTDTVDPATSAAWTAAGVNAAQIGPTVVS